MPVDAESVPEAAPAPPPEMPAAPLAMPEPETNHQYPATATAEIAREDASLPPPPVETNHRMPPAEVAPPATPEPSPVPAAPRKIEFDDAPRAKSRMRLLILAGVLIVILALGAALSIRQYLQRGSSVVSVDPNKIDNKQPKPEPIPEKKPPDPKPIDEPKPEKEKTKAPPLKATNFVVVSWYTTEDVPYFSPPNLKYYIDDDLLDDGKILLVVKARLSGKALAAKKNGGKWEFDLNVAEFAIDDEGQKIAADGLENKGGFMELVGKESRLVKKHTEKLDSEPAHLDVGLVFMVDLESADDLALHVHYRDFPAVKLDATTRQKAPAAPAKKVEPEKKVETKTPKNEEKKIEPEPKKVEEKSKKVEPEPKKTVVEIPPAEPQVEIVEWYVGDTLPSADPENKRMPLSSTDRLDGNIFVAVQVKLIGKACVAKKGAVSWNVSLAAKDFSIQGDAPQPFAGRGLQNEGAYGATLASGYVKYAVLVIPFKEEPESLVQGVFFTIPRAVVDRGDLELFFRDFPPVKLVESKRKK